MKNVQILGGAGDTTVGATASAKDNLYLSVNGEWLKTAVIPDDKPRTGGFSDLDEGVEKQMMSDLKTFAEDDSTIPNNLMREAVKLYRVGINTDKLNSDGAQPLQADLQVIKNLQSFSDVDNQLTQLVMKGFPLPFSIVVDADMKDTSTNVVYAYAPSLILPDKTYYDNNQSGQKLLEVYKDVTIKTLVKVGFNEDEAQQITEQAIEFDASLVPLVKSSEEWADYTKAYNPVDFNEFTKKVSSLKMDKLIKELIKDTPDKVIVTEPRYFNGINQVLDGQFENLKSWMTVNKVLASASLLGEDIRQTAGAYNLALSGSKTLSDPIKAAYHRVSNTFSEILGVYYGDKYFGQAAKDDVISMIHKMVDIYKKRLKENDWLGEATKQKAVVKLEKIAIKVGYPDKVEEVFNLIKVDESLSLYENMQKISQVFRQYRFDKYPKPVDRDEWAMPGHMVNACYDPARNDITFPAAILQAPFYSLQQSSSQNYGGIGAVIAHEISHAFDNNGAKFDELGNLNNWWTDQDYAKFEKLTQAMVKEFDGVEYAGGKVNGTLVVSENVADVGGLSCALEAAKTHDDVDLQEFFKNWARVWRIKLTTQFAELLLSTDVHAPGPMRANVHAQNMDDFYKAFNITPDDGMWLDEDQRVNIW
ncbi:M13-type metalloendopeptidase [Lactobacillus sp. YT155]|uniref:M13 family metallopeptidase n=1 Tax=Lactobacillus sp. YT155 TaxID=3060955 RepID=UPI00265F34BD|nr:M13-type metalloendopeptidase [Lactobacillus sp. YT155]MDO1605744.1 M13-type metalloendopeptidase [Lactobacillus sp. YT155]